MVWTGEEVGMKEAVSAEAALPISCPSQTQSTNLGLLGHAGTGLSRDLAQQQSRGFVEHLSEML